jgi:hypothetical protein
MAEVAGSEVGQVCANPSEVGSRAIISSAGAGISALEEEAKLFMFC